MFNKILECTEVMFYYLPVLLELGQCSINWIYLVAGEGIICWIQCGRKGHDVSRGLFCDLPQRSEETDEKPQSCYQPRGQELNPGPSMCEVVTLAVLWLRPQSSAPDSIPW